MGYVAKEVYEDMAVEGEGALDYLTEQSEKWIQSLIENKRVNEDQVEEFYSLKQILEEVIPALEILKEKNGGLTDKEQALYDIGTNLLSLYENLSENFVITEDFANKLAKSYPKLSDAIEENNGVYSINITKLNELAQQYNITTQEVYDLLAAEVSVNSQGLDFSSQIEALKNLATQAGYTASAIAMVFSMDETSMMNQIRSSAAGIYRSGIAKTSEEAMQMARESYIQALWDSLSVYSDSSTEPKTNLGGGAKQKLGGRAKQKTDEALKTFEKYYNNLQHLREMNQIDDEEYYKQLSYWVEWYTKNATEHMEEYGTDVDTINRNMYRYEEEIYKGRAKLAEDLAEQQKKAAEEAAQAQKEALEKQKEDFETAVNYVIKQIDEEISKLQDLRDQTEQYYDDKIDAVNKANDALEDQIQYEELLNNLAKAKDKQLYVFQNGQFQYVQDVEAIASAQAELDAYERDEALRKEVENLETLKDQALASIDEQIEGWEKYKEQWESVTTQYQEQQDKLLAEQVLGIDTEQKNWENRLANVQSFVDQ